MAVALVQTATGAGATDDPHDVVFSGAPAEGNVIVAWVTYRTGRTLTPPTGFTPIVGSPVTLYTGNLVGDWYYKVAGASEGTTYQWVVSGSGAFGAIVMAEFSGLDTADLVEASAAGTETSGATSHTAASVSPAAAGALTLWGWGGGTDASGSMGSRTYTNGATELDFRSTGGANNKQGVAAYKIQGASGTYDETFNFDDGASSSSLNSVSVAINAAVAPDTTPPTITITQPSASNVVAGTVEIRATFTDNVTTAANAANMAVSINGGGGAAMTWDAANGWWDYQWDTTGVADGATTIDVSGDDEAANTGNATQVSVTVDNTAPSITLSYDLASPQTAGTAVEIRANITDTNTAEADITSVEVSINGGAYTAMTWDAGNSWWDYAWDTTGLSGAYTIDVHGTDVVDLGTANTGQATQGSYTINAAGGGAPGAGTYAGYSGPAALRARVVADGGTDTGQEPAVAVATILSVDNPGELLGVLHLGGATSGEVIGALNELSGGTSSGLDKAMRDFAELWEDIGG